MGWFQIGFKKFQTVLKGFKWVSNGLQICFKWASNGLQMGFKWVTNGVRMGLQRALNGFQMLSRLFKYCIISTCLVRLA